MLMHRRLVGSLRTVAALLLEDERYLPVFLRLEQELEALEQTSSALQRAQVLMNKAA
jgi:hypothetical protein